MELKDVLHFYIGCEVMGDYDGPCKGILTGIMNGGAECEIQFYLEGEWHTEESPEWNDTQDVKPILRPLSSVTDSEWSEVENEMDLIPDAEGVDMVKLSFMDDSTPNRMGWQWTVLAANILRSKGVDMDGLIESGKAIDATSLTQQQ